MKSFICVGYGSRNSIMQWGKENNTRSVSPPNSSKNFPELLKQKTPHAIIDKLLQKDIPAIIRQGIVYTLKLFFILKLQ